MKQSRSDASRRRVVIGVMGAGECDQATYTCAERLGALLAAAGYTVLCGGRGGVMEAVARGAQQAGGLTVGVLPGHDDDDSPPNRYIELPIFTGLSFARNVVNVLSSRVVIALSGGPGTLSEIALALKYQKPVILIDSWEFRSPGSREPEQLYRVSSPEEALERVRLLLGDTEGT